MSKMKRRVLFAFTCLGSALTLAACNGVGQGNALKSLRIVNGTPTTAEAAQGSPTNIDAFECQRQQISAIGQFSKADDSLGTFTGRVRWSSSNPAVAAISNLNDTPSPTDPTLFFGPGTVTPVSVGTTTITADYLDLTASVTLTVKPTVGLQIAPLDARIATNSRLFYTLTSLVDGVRQTFDPMNTSKILRVNPAVDTVARIDTANTNAVVGFNPGGPVNVEFSLPACGRTVGTTARVADMQRLVLQHQTGFNGELVVGNTEAPLAFADFGDGPEQDVSSALISTYSLVDATKTQLAVFNGTVSAVTAGAAADVVVKCCFLDRDGNGLTTGPREDQAFTSNALTITPVAGTLTSFAIDPTSATVAQGGAQTYTGIGSFDGGARTQPIPVTVTLSALSDDDRAFLVASGPAVGPAGTVTENRTFNITITSALSGGTALTVTTPLTITPPVAP